MNKNRLRWACRRGMLELDLLLEPFVEHFYESLEESDQLRFEALLESEDQSLFMWLMKRQAPESPEMQRIVQIIHESRSQTS